MGAAGSQARVAQIAAALRAYVEHQRELGVLGFPPAPPAVTSRTTPAAVATPVAATTPDLFAAPGVSAAGSLEALREHIGDCRRCKLAPHRTHLVFGVGNPRARLVFVGEAPGRDEDAQGEPFVGRAGQLLTEIITKGMRLRREDVYIANVIKCRPPENRNPEPDEVASCEPFLLRQLELIRPEVVVALGKFAVQTLLRTKAPITQLRGRWYDYHGIKLMPTFHPAYLLRNPADKRLVWEDIRKVMQALGISGGRA
jgi:uracil-DNA glycosylase family 4